MTDSLTVSREDYRRYQSMRAADIPVWRAHLATYPDRYTAIIYNARLGGLSAAPADATPGDRALLLELLAKRPDALALRRDHTLECIEVKPRGRFDAVGQALGYATLAAREIRAERNNLREPNPLSAWMQPLRGLPIIRFQPAVICAWSDPDARRYLEESGGLWFDYPQLAQLYTDRATADDSPEV